MQFKRATEEDRPLKLALCGPTGSGKTLTSLLLASGMGSRIAVIDSEKGRARDYASYPGIQPYDVLELDRFSPLTYKEALDLAVKEGYDVVIIDSLSHEWVGKGGCLELVSNQTGNSYTAWKNVTPLHNALIDAIVACPIHVIATIRAKMQYVLEEDEKGRHVPRKVGLGPVQRDGIEYEWMILGEMDTNHILTFTTVHGVRYSRLLGLQVEQPTLELGKAIVDGDYRAMPIDSNEEEKSNA